MPGGADEVFKHSQTGKQTFVIKGEKVPNAAGIRRVLAMLGGPTATYEEFVSGAHANLRGGLDRGGIFVALDWRRIACGLPEWIQGRAGFAAQQPDGIGGCADSGAAWAEKEGCWENYAGKMQPFEAAVAPPEGVRRDGDVYMTLFGRQGLYHAETIRRDMGGAFAEVKMPGSTAKAHAPMEFVALKKMD